MNIGGLLKKYRTAQGITQKDWCGDIVSPSYYSKVEKNEHRISAEDLVKILNHNQVDLVDFFMQLSSTNHIQSANIKLNLLSYTNDRQGILQLEKEVAQSEKFSSHEKKLFAAQTAYFLHVVMDDQPECLSEEHTDILKEYLFTYNEWTLNKLGMYANFTGLYDFNTNQFMISSILKKELASYSYREQIIIQTILVNVLDSCIENNCDELAYHYLSLIDQFPTHTDNFLQKTVAKFVYYLLEYRKSADQQYVEKINSLCSLFEELKIESLGERLLEFFEKNKVRK